MKSGTGIGAAMAMILLLGSMDAALGCPVCDTGAGEQVRRGILESGPAAAAGIVAPFGLMALFAVWIHRRFPAPAACGKASR